MLSELSESGFRVLCSILSDLWCLSLEIVCCFMNSDIVPSHKMLIMCLLYDVLMP